jgi:hypothetical protein
MSDISPREVYIRRKKVNTRLSTLKNGIWSFDNQGNYIVKYNIDGVPFYEIPFIFGVCESYQFEPSIVQDKGQAGDLLCVDQNGVMTIFNKEKFEKTYPNLSITKK